MELLTVIKLADNLKALMNKGYTRQQATDAVAGILPPKKTYTSFDPSLTKSQPFSWGQTAKNVWDGSQPGLIAGGVTKAYDWLTKPTTPPNPNAGFMGVPATTSYFDQLAARDGDLRATQAIDSARAYQRDHPTELPPTIRPYVPTYSPEDVNRQLPIVMREKEDDKGANAFAARNAAAYYSYQDDDISVRPMYAAGIATSPTTANNHMPTLGTHETTHSITPFANAYRRLVPGSRNKDKSSPNTMEHDFNPQAEQDLALITYAGKAQAERPKDTPHGNHPEELSSLLSDYKKTYAASANASTITDTPEKQKAFRDWVHSKANPSAVKQTDGSYGPTSDSVWGQMNQLTPEQQSYLMGSIVKGQTPQQPTSTTPYSQYQA